MPRAIFAHAAGRRDLADIACPGRFDLPLRRAKASDTKTRSTFLPAAKQTTVIADKVAALLTEAGLNTILDGIGDGFYAVDRDWRIILFNREAERHFRRPPEDVLGRKLWELFPDAARPALGKLFIEDDGEPRDDPLGNRVGRLPAAAGCPTGCFRSATAWASCSAT